ncbi:type II secretion system ATPase GspE [Stenotrophomonas sp. UBA7606]|uniref:type II secretion system ATPase GspE n=1 Tax=Stenotrophomonas sp. UBA7606 TaxID=1947559 RepID=UPI0025E84556|nr:type II secretion system ATPase GspE [Stenotrophomonas sp. UBA7606]
MHNEELPVATAAGHAVSATVRLPLAFARRHGVLLLDDDPVRIVCRADAAMRALAEAQRFAGKAVPSQVIADAVFEQQLQQLYQQDSSTAMSMADELGDSLDLASLVEGLEQVEDLLDQQDDAPIIRLINALLGEAVAEQASDIHIETFERRLVVRFRVDGILRDVVEPRRELATLLVSRIKVMARLDIAEKRLPQDGRISVRVGSREVDIRVSTLPAANGERVVLRLLDKQSGQLSLQHLGMRVRDVGVMQSMLFRPHGIVLVTGPTGAGKSTTLYAGLRAINNRQRNILTVEDPIEYHLDGVGQTQVNPRIDMTFARGLRAILRQDPDVLMVGEIRDGETARIAVQASLTGHLVLSTLHTNSAVGAVARLLDMGVESFLLSSSLLGVLAQRLVRRLCPGCRVASPASAAECAQLGIESGQRPLLFRPVGCPQCNGQGYRGRTGIYELVEFGPELRALVHAGAGEAELLAQARLQGPSMLDDGRAKVLDGVTTLEEVLRVGRDP